jgi:hypothetical protein
MGASSVAELMTDMEQRAEDRMGLLQVLESAEMMHVTREAITQWLEEDRQREREIFGALSRRAA